MSWARWNGLNSFPAVPVLPCFALCLFLPHIPSKPSLCQSKAAVPCPAPTDKKHQPIPLLQGLSLQIGRKQLCMFVFIQYLSCSVPKWQQAGQRRGTSKPVWIVVLGVSSLNFSKFFNYWAFSCFCWRTPNMHFPTFSIKMSISIPHLTSLRKILSSIQHLSLQKAFQNCLFKRQNKDPADHQGGSHQAVQVWNIVLPLNAKGLPSVPGKQQWQNQGKLYFSSRTCEITQVVRTFGNHQHAKIGIAWSHNSSWKLPEIPQGWAELM